MSPKESISDSSLLANSDANKISQLFAKQKVTFESHWCGGSAPNIGTDIGFPLKSYSTNDSSHQWFHYILHTKEFCFCFEYSPIQRTLFITGDHFSEIVIQSLLMKIRTLLWSMIIE